MIMSVTATDCAGPNSPCMLKGELFQCMDHARRLGFEGVELHMRNAKLNDYHELAEFAKMNEIKVTSIGTGAAYSMDGYNLTAPDKESRKEAGQVLIDFLEAGHTLGGAAVMLGLMKGRFPNPKEKEKYMNILEETLKPVVEAAEKYECDLTLEAISRFWTDCLWTAEETLDFVNRFDSDRVTVHLDTFHMNIEEKDMEQAIRICKGKLGHMHLADSNRLYPGAGHFDFETCINTLYDIGYDKAAAFEYDAKPTGIEGAMKGLAHIKQFLR